MNGPTKLNLRIALTFDDGPHPKNTEALINILSKTITPATFFVLGQNGRRWPHILRLMHEAGHEIGNHGWSHTSFDSLRDADVLHELSQTSDLIRQVSSQDCSIYRPPYGVIAERQRILVAEHLGLRLVRWNVDSLDWQRPRIDQLIRNVANLTTKSAILLFHDFCDVTHDALPRLIDTLLTCNGTFYTVSQIWNLATETRLP